eukprot:SAG31_NODE_436_length_15717_cov_5.420412_16_plen_241_part_00
MPEPQKNARRYRALPTNLCCERCASRDELLGVQIDAAINSGNSGGPAFNESGQCIGIAFQSMAGSGDAENIGYVIPTAIVDHFLADYDANGCYTGFPALGLCWQTMESPDLRRAFGMAKDEKGVLVRRVAKAGAASGQLQPRDVVLTVDGIPVANDGTVTFRDEERINFSYLVSGAQCCLCWPRNSKCSSASNVLQDTSSMTRCQFRSCEMETALSLTSLSSRGHLWCRSISKAKRRHIS